MASAAAPKTEAPAQASTDAAPVVNVAALTFVAETNRASKREQADVESRIRAATPGTAAIFHIVTTVKDGKTTSNERGIKTRVTKALKRMGLTETYSIRVAMLNGEKVVAAVRK